MCRMSPVESGPVTLSYLHSRLHVKYPLGLLAASDNTFILGYCLQLVVLRADNALSSSSLPMVIPPAIAAITFNPNGDYIFRKLNAADAIAQEVLREVRLC